jgi:mannitol-specific phosphotransferase system IIBC component
VEPRHEPRLIRTIGFVYALDYMPAPLLVGYNQLRRKVERAGFQIEVSLVPLNDLPDDLDILFVPAALETAARQAVPGKWTIAVESYLNHPSYNALVERLAEGREIRALRTAEIPPAHGNVILRYRGNVRID